MKYRRLGRSGPIVSKVAYGNAFTAGKQLTDDRAEACIRAALDAGINTFDTADVYSSGVGETVLGRALKAERREGLVVCTKVYFPTGPGPDDRGLSRKHIMSAIDGSLRRLGMDYVDVYVAHRYDQSTPLEETLHAFADLVWSGKVLYIGVSEWEAPQLQHAMSMAVEMNLPLVCNQPQYSMLWRAPERDVIPACAELGLSQMVWSPVAGGVLSGKYVAGEAAPEGSRATIPGGDEVLRRWGHMDDEVLVRVNDLRQVAEEVGMSMSQLAIVWVLQQQNISSAIIGASRPEQIVENAKAAERDALDPDQLARIDKSLAKPASRDAAQSPPGELT